MDDTTPGGGSAGAGGPSGVPGMAPPPATGGPVAERMQALLSRAVEEQVSEQRQFSGVLGDLRLQVAGIADQIRGLSSGDRVEQLASDLGSLTTELRRSTTSLGERVDAVARTVEAQASSAADTAAGGSAGMEALAVRLGALGADVASQGASLDRVSAALGALSSFPDALAALQSEIAGLHDRLTALSDLRNGLADLAVRTATLEAMRPDMTAVAGRVQQLSTAADVAAASDSTLSALGERLDRLDVAAQRPVLTAADLDFALADLRTHVQEAAAGGAALGRLDAIEQRFGAVEEQLAGLAARVTEVHEVAGGVPDVATNLAAVAGRLDALDPLREQVTALGADLAAMREADTAPALAADVALLRQDVEDLGARVDGIAVPSAHAVALAVSNQVGDRIVDALAPRVADVVLTRVAAVLVEQVAGTVTASVQNGLTERVRAATAESERRMSAHVDEAILALAEALLRRRRPGRGTAAPAAARPADDLTTAVPLPGLAAVQGRDQPAAADSQSPEGPASPEVAAPADDGAPDEQGPLGRDADPAAPTLGDEPVVGSEALPDTAEAQQAEAEPGDRDEPPPAEVDEGGTRTADDGPMRRADLEADAAAQDEDGGARASAGSEAGAPGAEAEPPQAPAEVADPGEGDDDGASERTGAFALRSGLRGLGLDVEDPVLDEPDPSVRAARPAPPARPRLLDPTPDGDDDDREPVRARPTVQPRPDVRERFASAANAFDVRDPGTREDDDGDDEDDAGPRRRPWWRPGG